MDLKRLLTGTIGGGIVLFAVGYLIFDLAFGSFYEANGGTATGVDREMVVWWSVALASFAYAALITLGIGTAKSSGVGAGVKVGAVVGFLLWFTVDFTFYGYLNLNNLALTVVDPLLELVRGGVVGGAIALMLGKGSAPAAD